MFCTACPAAGDRQRPSQSGRFDHPVQEHRSGFTLLELLVVTAIVVALIGLLMPAVQSARESARLSACSGNLKQLAQAMLHHETSLGYFPSGGWGPDWLPSGDRSADSSQPGGWTFAVLPFAERLDVAQVIANTTASTSTADYQSLASTGDNLFACSSRRTAKSRSMAAGAGYRTAFDACGTLSISLGAVSDFAANGGSTATCPAISVLQKALQYVSATASIPFCHVPNGNPSNQNTLTLPLSGIQNGHAGHTDDHVGPCLTCGNDMDTVVVEPTSMTQGDQWRAIVPMGRLVLPDGGIPDMQDGIVHRMSQIRSSSIKDGEGYTYLLGEKYVDAAAYDKGSDAGDDRVMFAGYSSGNVRWAYDPPAKDKQRVSQPNVFGSAHRGGWNVAFADGGVRTLSFDIDPTVHRGLAARADGSVVRPD